MYYYQVQAAGDCILAIEIHDVSGDLKVRNSLTFQQIRSTIVEKLKTTCDAPSKDKITSCPSIWMDGWGNLVKMDTEPRKNTTPHVGNEQQGGKVLKKVIRYSDAHLHYNA